MIDVRPTNQKLRARIVRMLVQATGLETDECEQTLHRAGGEIHVALVMLLAGVGVDEAREALRGAGAPGELARTRSRQWSKTCRTKPPLRWR